MVFISSRNLKEIPVADMLLFFGLNYFWRKIKGFPISKGKRFSFLQEKILEIAYS